MYQHSHVLPHSSYFPIISRHVSLQLKKKRVGGSGPQDPNIYITFNKSACTQLFAGMHTAFHIVFQYIQHHVTAIFVSKSNDNLVTMMTFHNS